MACAENASRDEISRLEALVTAQAKEIAALNSQVNFLKASGSRGAAKCARCGFQDASEMALAMDSPDAPIFPNEIFLLISTHLDPGTRSLLNLARSCRALYELLISRLYQSFSLGRIWSRNVFAATRNDKDTSSLPHGLWSVQHLNLGTRDDVENGNLHVIYDCKNLVTLECDMHMIPLICGNLPLLEKVEVNAEDDLYFVETAQRLAEISCHGMPNVRILKLTGRPCSELMEFFLDSCPRLSDVHFACDYDEDFNFDPTTMPVGFVAKIRVFDSSELPLIATIIEHFPSFAPERIICHDDDVGGDDWQDICGLASLKKLQMSAIDSTIFLSSVPPQNLEFFCVVCLEPSLYRLDPTEFNTALKDLGERLASLQRTIQFEIDYPVIALPHLNLSDAEFRRFAAELRVWQTVPGFSLQGHAGQVEALELRMSELGI